MKRTNWKAIEKQMTELKRKAKNMAAATAYLTNKPEKGYFIDNISKNTVKISDCKSSTLRRYVGLLDKYYYLAVTPTDKQYFLDKKIEIESELNSRGDDEVK